jgi:hypothetical protein
MILLLSFLGLSGRKGQLEGPHKRKDVSEQGFLVACEEYP